MALRPLGLSENQKDILTNTLLVVFSISIVLAGMEVGLRTGFVQPASSPDQVRYCDGPQIRGTFHPQYGWTEQPNSQFLEKSSVIDDWSRFTHNKKGFRDTYASGNRSVIILGDSFTHGSLVDDQSTFAYLLDKEHSSTRFENYGMGGYGTGNELMVYRNISSRYNHDVVVLAYFLGNDILNNVDNWTNRPQFEVQDGEAVLVHEPRQVEQNDYNRTEYGVIGDIHSWLQIHFATYNWLFTRFQPLLQVVGIGEKPPQYPPPQTEWDHQLNVTRALLDEVAEEAEQNNARLVLLTIPTRGEVNPKNPAYAGNPQPFFDVQRQMVHSFAADHANVDTIELKPALREERQNGNHVYGRVDAHLNDRGHAVTARAIDSYLVRNDYVEDSGDISTNLAAEANIDNCSRSNSIKMVQQAGEV